MARLVLAGVIMIGAFGTIGAQGTLSQFSDAHDGQAFMNASTSFGGEGGGGNLPNNHAYVDTNENGQYDDGEPTHNTNNLRSFNEPGATLVVPSSAGTIQRNGNGDVSMTTGSIDADADIDANNGNVDVTATSGDVTLAGQSVESGSDSITIEANGDVDLSDATLSANEDVTIIADGTLNLDGATIDSNGDIELRAQEISAQMATLDPMNGGSIVSATRNGGGTIDATGASMSGGNDGITLESSGSVVLNNSQLDSQNGQATADLGLSNATLYVEGTEIQDSDDTLVYDPDEIDIVGSPETGQTSEK